MILRNATGSAKVIADCLCIMLQLKIEKFAGERRSPNMYESKAKLKGKKMGFTTNLHRGWHSGAPGKRRLGTRPSLLQRLNGGLEARGKASGQLIPDTGVRGSIAVVLGVE